MYKKAIGSLLLGSMLFLFGAICVDGAALERQFCVKTADPVNGEYVVTDHAMGITDKTVSNQRVAKLQKVCLAETRQERLDAEERELLFRIVEAEAGNQDADGRLLVANVVLNRVRSEEFPDTVRGVVLQQQDGCFQFSPAENGRLWQVTVSEASKEAVERAMSGEDISEGALYFAARQYADQSSMKWFDDHLTYLFAWGDHEFFK